MPTSAAFDRDLVEFLGWKAEDDAASFDVTLKAFRRAKFEQTTKGKVLTGTSSGGTSVEYTLPQIGSYTERDISESGEKIARAVEAIRVDDEDITDADLIIALIARFQAVRSFNRDFRGLASGATAASTTEE